MKIFKAISIFLIAIFLTPCFQSWAEDSIHKLPSGKEIKIRGIGKIYLMKDEKFALTLKYETDIDLENYELLREEVQEIWPIFRGDVEKSGLEIAVIMPTSHREQKGFFISTSKSKHFGVIKKENGTWDLNRWKRDYESESKQIAEGFLEANKNSDVIKMSKSFHIPKSFTSDQLNKETSGISESLKSVIDELGGISSYKFTNSKFKAAFMGIQSLSQEYWRKYPYFNQLIYDVNFTKQGRGYLSFVFSIINNKLVLQSIAYGLPEENPQAIKIVTGLLKNFVEKNKK